MRINSLFGFGLLVAVLVCSSILTADLQAGTKGQHARAMQRSGALFHEPSSGRENVYMDSGSRLGARFRARAAWRRSPGHRANLPLFGLRVASGPNGTYVVGRGR